MLEKENNTQIIIFHVKHGKHHSSPWHTPLSCPKVINVIANFYFKRRTGKNWKGKQLCREKKKNRSLVFLFKTSLWQMWFIRSVLLSSKFTENLTPGTATPIHSEPVSSRRQDEWRAVWGLLCRLSTTTAWVFSPHHLFHCQSGTSSRLFWLSLSLPILFSSWNNTISEYYLLLVVANTDTSFCFWMVPSSAFPNTTKPTPEALPPDLFTAPLRVSTTLNSL